MKRETSVYRRLLKKVTAIRHTSLYHLRRSLSPILIGFLATGCVDSPKRILFLGDSITHGVPHNYRYELWKYMLDAGWNVDLLGTVEDWNEYPVYRDQKFDTDHEGHSGWTSNQINASLTNWLVCYTPDIVLYHIGTNDLWQYEVDTSMSRIAETVSQLRSDNPGVQIYLSQIIPIGEGNEWVKEINGYEWLELFNQRIVGLADSLHTPRSPVLVVDHYTDFIDSDLSGDKVHPNADGAKKMARNWAKSLQLIP